MTIAALITLLALIELFWYELDHTK